MKAAYNTLADRILVGLSGTEAGMMGPALRKQVGAGFFESLKIPGTLGDLSRQKLVASSFVPGHVMLTVEGERTADKLRLLSKEQSQALEQAAVLRILANSSEQRALQDNLPPHVGFARYSMLRDTLIKHNYLTTNCGLTDKGAASLKFAQAQP